MQGRKLNYPKKLEADYFHQVRDMIISQITRNIFQQKTGRKRPVSIYIAL